MSSLPNSLKNISLFLERLPGIGEKTANRLAFFLLNLPEEDLKEFANNVSDLKSKTKLCKNCFNFTEKEICEICEDGERNHSIICVVETVLDLLSFEQGRIYNGVYHVLHGKIDPLNRVGPDDLKIRNLESRIQNSESKIKEIILATNPDMEGEATAVYIKNKLTEIKKLGNLEIKISRLAYGLPMGANLEYADYMTLKKAIEGRNKF
ncbi:recombination protein RecR [Candidatus Roizmanbacteria bacterium CG_4_8_14_3_um_filter_34_9]|uniref:Recombination protein RecR n=3 Tax=Candidatus Roizmaniibacteriota TaxID=1752723 RepID=A0A2M7ATS8_9BACT|nr:MAG: recombination protein RecR [Candidatus Roizmanbacteria bacterium CG07_land_8_20_14_0_80_34_15]PIU74024.1 MAG: recombination protein RecR [Candidatus Roizmanbacteria bacterium CG06_land_8_20_14_3_00_34_14]PIW73147.1 MAG: recombination protein RecR [Candidatus Roizmanbacteria bacterium CG_4_8_14_3_um_filter_34_9]